LSFVSRTETDKDDDSVKRKIQQQIFTERALSSSGCDSASRNIKASGNKIEEPRHKMSSRPEQYLQRQLYTRSILGAQPTPIPVSTQMRSEGDGTANLEGISARVSGSNDMSITSSVLLHTWIYPTMETRLPGVRFTRTERVVYVQ
jgi:hypothetical protein